MNVKAEKFEKMLIENNINCFEKQEAKDELNTVVFRSLMEIEGVRLPVIIIIDDSIYTIFRTQILGGIVSDKNRVAVQGLINKLNGTYKAFKYLITDDGDILLDSCLLSSNEHFDPNLIRVMIDVAIKNLSEVYRQIVKATWDEENK